MASSLTEPEQAHFAKDAATVPIDKTRDWEEDEWEYEYSSTETETYYLTVELSYPELLDRAIKVSHHHRGGYYKNWVDQQPEKPRTVGGPVQDDQNDNDDEPIPDAEGDDDDADIDPQLLQNDKGKGVEKGPAKNREDVHQSQQDEEEREKPEATEDIQILELHSDNPVISYKGRVFEGHWAEIIGTEAIFAYHDAEHPLPALRNLVGDVDLLAASASRIMTKEKVVKPKIPEKDPLQEIKDEWNIRIPVGKDRTGERAQQTRFLENLIALKKKKGEKDLVTVYARDGEGKHFKDHQDPDYKPRRRRRLMNSDGEEITVTKVERPRSRRKTGRPRGTGRTPWRGAGAYMPEGSHSRTTLSTPTPARWNELDEDDGGDDEDEMEEDNEDDDDDEDVSMMDQR